VITQGLCLCASRGAANCLFVLSFRSDGIVVDLQEYRSYASPVPFHRDALLVHQRSPRPDRKLLSKLDRIQAPGDLVCRSRCTQCEAEPRNRTKWIIASAVAVGFQCVSRVARSSQ
jgi:hypothetical protein